MNLKTAKFIRTITTAPIIALIMLSIIFIVNPLNFYNTFHFIMSVIFLSILPILAYPFVYIIKPLRVKGRETQRNTAIIFSILGYIGGIVFCLLSNTTELEITIYFTYLISGLLIALLSFIFKFKCSGHTSGVAGPISMLTYCVGILSLIGIVILILVYWSSIILKRHSIIQLLAGSVVPIVAMLISILIASKLT